MRYIPLPFEGKVDLLLAENWMDDEDRKDLEYPSDP